VQNSNNPSEDIAKLRRHAEEQLKESTETEPQTVADANRLIHELEVHKIELEMQNAELCKSRDDVEILGHHLRRFRHGD
jgi:hypothetical protein